MTLSELDQQNGRDPDEENQKKMDVMEYPQSRMEAIWIEVEDFPTSILVDDKGNDCFRQILH